ncbi:hypothetical protein CALVIDRAFT_540916 [Calocera viscosa TUFC12733]|uniref:Uncharacterized protein n=1 Tax=Calocera viscosa (strain TUFC12733) TaxID=1330018 RepID=A0A167IAK0_CALVF|nr:hypothetical protein CALVIDRAFT_540916 [Calocera viscosa TUFC12733]
MWIGGYLRPLRALPPMPRLLHDDGANSQVNGGPLFRLPSELLRAIGEEVLCRGLIDLISFAATCHHLWDVFAPIFAAWAMKMTWAGCRIICLGDYMRDLPGDLLLSDTQRAELFECGTQHAHSIRSDVAEEERTPSTLYAFAEKHYWSDLDVRVLLRRSIWRRGLTGAPKIAVQTMYAARNLRSMRLVLRNLTKKLYVRSRAVDDLNGQLFEQDEEAGITSDDEYGYCLGDALMSRICWSSDPSCSMWGQPEDLTRGPWAGDRFDVITVEEFDKEDKDQWQDASEDVCRVLKNCWNK